MSAYFVFAHAGHCISNECTHTTELYILTRVCVLSLTKQHCDSDRTAAKWLSLVTREVWSSLKLAIEPNMMPNHIPKKTSNIKVQTTSSKQRRTHDLLTHPQGSWRSVPWGVQHGGRFPHIFRPYHTCTRALTNTRAHSTHTGTRSPPPPPPKTKKKQKNKPPNKTKTKTTHTHCTHSREDSSVRPAHVDK